MVDTQDEMVVQPTLNEKDSVAEINPEQLDNEAENLENVILATDCTCDPVTLRGCRPILTLLVRFSRGHGRDSPTSSLRRAQDFGRCRRHLDCRELESALQEGAWSDIPRRWISMVSIHTSDEP